MERWFPRWLLGFRTLVMALAAGFLILLPLESALAHEGEEEVPAKTLVEQAIALLRRQPDQVEAIRDKILDALGAEDTAGVDLSLVREASKAFESGRIHEAWDLLEEAIGAAPHRVVATPNPEPGIPAPPAPSPEPSSVLHERALEGGVRGPEGLAGPVLLGLAVALGALGVVVVRRVR